MMLPALSPLVQGSMLCATALTVAISVWFYRRQRGGGLGGRVSPPKAAWLCFAILYWFLICPLLTLDSQLPDPWRMTLVVFGVNIWIRGLIELFMLLVTRNWRPPYGIAHDIFSLLLVVITPLCTGLNSLSLTGWGGVGALAVGTLALSLALETYYAVIFHQLVEGKTTGDDGVWFADAADPKFQRINRITAIFNPPLFASLGFILIASWGVFS